MSELMCPKCRGTLFVPIRKKFVYRRSLWTLFKWQRACIADVAGCEGCKRTFEIGDLGVVQLSEPPRKMSEPPIPPHEDDEKEPREPRHGMSDRVERPEVGLEVE